VADEQSGVRVRLHREAGVKVVLSAEKEGDDDTVIQTGDRIPKSLYDKLQKKENYGRATYRSPDGYPLVEKYEEGS
jgi:hypothetical protein